MLLMTTTPAIEGRPVKTYLGIVSGEAAVEMQFFDRNSEKNLHDARQAAMAQMSARAQKLGATAVVGIAFDVEAFAPTVRMLLATGTAVVL
jgi:uncharacterized protein YbjQ (UPF0145 family)